MNLKGFKKTHEDNHKAVLKNKKGHEITIAKKSLTSKHLKELSNLPLHAAEGADIEQSLNDQQNFKDLAMSQSEPATEEMAPQTDVLSQRSPQQAATPAAIQEAQVEQPVQMVPQSQEDALPRPEARNMPDQARERRKQAEQQYNIDHAEEMGIQDARFDQDLTNGHIQKKTYADLFESKSTLGKIGTVFGLLLAGAGSGLTKQPNLALQMMDKQIDDDFQSQKESKTNAQNFYKLNLENQINKSKILQLKKEGRLTESQEKAMWSEIQLKTDNHTKNQMEISLLHDLQGNVDKLPVNSPARMQNQNVLNGIKNAAETQRIQRNIRTSQALKDTQAAYEQRTKQMHQMAIFNPAWETQAKDRESKEIPGIGYSNTPISPESKDKVKKINEFNMLLNEYEGLGNKVGWRGNLGTLTPSERARATSIRNDLISSYNDVKGLTRFTGNEEQLYKNIVPDIGNMNLTGSQRDLLKRLKGSVAEKYKQELKTSGIKPFGDSKKESTGSVQEGSTGTYKGKPVVFRNGKWGYR